MPQRDAMAPPNTIAHYRITTQLGEGGNSDGDTDLIQFSGPMR